MNDLLYYVKENQTPTYSSLNFFIFLSLRFSNIKKVRRSFLRGLQKRILVHTWTVGFCIMYTSIKQLVLIYSFISSVFFLSNSKTLNFCHTFLLDLQRWNLIHTWAMVWSILYTKIKQPVHTCSLFFFYLQSFQLAYIKNLHLQTCSIAHCLLYFFALVVRSFVPEINFSLSAHVSARKKKNIYMYIYIYIYIYIYNTHNFYKIATFVWEVNMGQLASHRVSLPTCKIQWKGLYSKIYKYIDFLLPWIRFCNKIFCLGRLNLRNTENTLIDKLNGWDSRGFCFDTLRGKWRILRRFYQCKDI